MISEWEALTLRQILRSTMVPDANAGPDGRYLVRSLYFDDVYDTAYLDKLAGVQLRKKYRIRTYGNNKEGAVIKAECKFKQDSYIAKTSAAISADGFYRILQGSYDFLFRENHELLRDFYTQLTGGLRPKVIVDYDREAYIVPEGNVRVTFDHSVRSGFNTYDIFSKDLWTMPVFEPNQLVLEVKYDEFIPNKVRNLLKLNALEEIAVSKYVLCRMRQLA